MREECAKRATTVAGPTAELVLRKEAQPFVRAVGLEAARPRRFVVVSAHCGYLSTVELAPHQTAEGFESELQHVRGYACVVCTSLALLVAWAAWSFR